MTFIKHMSCIRNFFFLAKTETLAFFEFFFTVLKYLGRIIAAMIVLYSVCACDHFTQRLHLYFNIIGNMHYRSWFHFSIKNTTFRSKPHILWNSFLEVWMQTWLYWEIVENCYTGKQVDRDMNLSRRILWFYLNAHYSIS